MIRKLLDRPPSDRKAGAPLPVLWQRAHTAAAESLSRYTGNICVAGEGSVTPTSARQYLSDEPSPGLLVPLEAEEQDHQFLQLSTEVTRRLSSTLLHVTDAPSAGGEETDENKEEEPPLSDLDANLACQAVRCAVDTLSDVLSTSFRLMDEAVPLLEWPVSLMTGDRPWSVVTLQFILGDHPLSFSLLLDGNETSLMTDTPPAQKAISAALLSPVTLTASLDSWVTGPSALNDLAPGAILPLPGAALDRVTMSVRVAGKEARVAIGDHGRAGRNQAVRLSSLEPVIAPRSPVPHPDNAQQAA